MKPSVKFLLLTLLLQLALAEATKFGFGDIFSVWTKGLYDHYAVYVGDKQFEGKKSDENIFEMTRKGCQFSKLEECTSEPKLKYQDTPEKRLPDAKIEENIAAKMKTACENKYNLFKNNCEHTATEVVFGTPICGQIDEVYKFAGNLCTHFNNEIKHQRGLEGA